MSIDFNVGIVREFTIHAFVAQTRRRLVDLTGLDAPISAQDWPSRSAYRDGQPGLTAGIEHVTCGPRQPDCWVRLSLGSNAVADVSVMSASDETGRDTDLEATAASRSASSVVVAMASVIAGADIGGGEFNPNVHRILGEAIAEPQVLTDRLRLPIPPGSNLETASRQLLHTTKAFADWAGLDEAGQGGSPSQSRGTGP